MSTGTKNISEICTAEPMSLENKIQEVKPQNKRRKIMGRPLLSRKQHYGDAKLLVTLKNLKRQNFAILNRNLNLKQRLRKAEEMFYNNPLKAFEGLNPLQLNFCKTQLRLSKYKPRGRRYTIEEKLFCLSLYKQSGRSFFSFYLTS
nr:uncharacterized protein LOC111416717 [Onthophagus taurus]